MKNEKDQRGRFAEGNSGRPIGSINKKAKKFKEAVSELATSKQNIEKLKTELDKLTGVQFLDYMLKFAKLFVSEPAKIIIQDAETEDVGHVVVTYENHK